MLEKYKQVSVQSKKYWTRALKLFPGGINHNIRTFGLDRCHAYPPFMERGQGSHLWDIDGNEYIDYWMTHFSMILGHNHPRIKEAIGNQLAKGSHLGALNEHQVVFGEMLQEAIPELKRMRFCSTGSEATGYAVRLCRLFTGKPLVAKVLGGWHGGNDSLGYYLRYPFDDGPYYNGVSFEFNDRDSIDVLMKKHGTKLAAVIVEPVIGAAGGIPPEPDFLPYLREETAKRDILLIFDEIITGFRLCYGVAGTVVFNVEPDLITLGKITASGMPLGVYGGREDVMALAAPGVPGGRWVGGGTFSSHPLSMVAGIATLHTLRASKEKYQSLNNNGERFCHQINEILPQDHAMAVGTGSIIFIHCLHRPIEEGPLTVTKLGDAFDKAKTDLFQSLLVEEGIFGYHGLGGLSFVHSQHDLDVTLKAIETVLGTLE